MAQVNRRSAAGYLAGLVWMLALTLLGGCATGDTAGRTGDTGGTAPPADVSGTWDGSFTGVGSTGFNFTFVAILEQKGNTVTGTISGASLASYNGPIYGTVRGNTFSWRRTMGSGSGSVTVSGNEMSGTGTGGYPGQLTLRRTQ
jgi:hypothetical protein